jgi:hypothetical protein
MGVALRSTNTEAFDNPQRLPSIVQSFFAPRSGYVSGVTIYLGSKDQYSGVEVQLRNMNADGTPGSIVLAKKFRRARFINVSDNSSAPCTFLFPNLARVQKGGHYGIAVITDSDEYLVWTCSPFGNDILTGQPILYQTEKGVLYQTSNGESWSVDQYADLKFQLLYAEFTAQTGTLQFQPIRGMVAGSLVLRSWLNLPRGTSINWYYSFNGNRYQLITPNNTYRFDRIKRLMYIKADFIGGFDPEGNLDSPSLNIWGSTVFAYAHYGRNVPWDYPNSLETSYVSKNTVLSGDGYSEIRTVTQEYIPRNCYVEMYMSHNDGDTWIKLPNSTADRLSGIKDYEITSLGGLMYEVTRSMTFNPINTPTYTGGSAPAKVAGSGSFVAGNYDVTYSFYNEFGESGYAAVTTVNSVSNGDRIQFTLPTSVNFPTDAGYNSTNPSTVSGIYVYVGSVGGTLKRVAFTGSVAAGSTITISSGTALVPEISPHSSNNSVPVNFRVRIRLIAPRFTFYVLDPDTILQGFTTGIDPSASIDGNAHYSLVYSWISDRGGETKPSTSLDGTSGKFYADTPNGSNQNWISIDNMPEFPDRASGMYVYIKKSTDIGAERRVNVTVTRNGVVTSVPFILPTDTGPFKIFSVPNTPGTTPQASNGTTPMTPKGPQVSRLRVIVHDEPVL